MKLEEMKRQGRERRQKIVHMVDKLGYRICEIAKKEGVTWARIKVLYEKGKDEAQ